VRNELANANLSKLHRVVMQRSSHSAMRSVRDTVDGFAQGMHEYEIRVAHRSAAGTSYDSKNNYAAPRERSDATSGRKKQ
jgi:hypothetical protein